MRVGNYGLQIVRADNEHRGTPGGSRGTGGVLRLSRKVGAVEDLSGAKRRSEAGTGAEPASVPKRPKLVKFIMS
jgi:hypothetical protein